jgi:hypothetical protein
MYNPNELLSPQALPIATISIDWLGVLSAEIQLDCSLQVVVKMVQ